MVRGEPLHQDVTEADPLADWPGEALTANMDEEEFTAWIGGFRLTSRPSVGAERPAKNGLSDARCCNFSPFRTCACTLVFARTDEK